MQEDQDAGYLEEPKPLELGRLERDGAVHACGDMWLRGNRSAGIKDQMMNSSYLKEQCSDSLLVSKVTVSVEA
ncbi:hypothetical protein PM082_009914 [Marasmius tenuissimus]|nr:hypothetical protein PM082_009914 [Marasmius tenuissimus]